MEQLDERGGSGIAARAGASSAAHWKRTVGLWLAFVVVALLIGGAAGQKKLTAAGSMVDDSAKAQKILDHANFSEPASENVLITRRA